MRVLGLILLVFLTVCGGVASAQAETKPAAPSSPQPTSVPTAADKSTIVYVSDFELDAVTGKDEKGAPVVAPAAAAQPDAKKEDSPAEQASKLVDFMSSSLVKELEKAGYTAHRLRPGQTLPEGGIRIKGVFAEPDEENRLRRAVIGNTTTVDKMALFVGVANLAKPDQPLYTVVDLQGSQNSENNPGAMINVSAYAPVAKFDVQKDATEKTIKDTAAAIVADLTTLLNTNVAAVTH
jgi:hypothetical protein